VPPERIGLRRPREPELPFAAQVSSNLFVRNNLPSLAISRPPTNRLCNVEVIQHVIQAAVVGQAIEERAHGVFGRHERLVD
jgi:hypothetical protein